MSLKYKFTDLILKLFSYAWAWVWSRLDNKFKRMCMLASLHAVLLKCDDTETKRIAELNNVLGLVQDVNALRLPTLFGPLLWKRVLPIEVIDVTTDRYIQRIVRMTPCWLLYTDESEFKKDLRRLLNYCNGRSLA